MESVSETNEVRREWRIVLREQGRNMAWLARETDKTYPQVTSYALGRVKVPQDWLDRVEELLGEPVR
jgi:hypothetical protein